jgi:hypothetical protein
MQHAVLRRLRSGQQDASEVMERKTLRLRLQRGALRIV